MAGGPALPTWEISAQFEAGLVHKYMWVSIGQHVHRMQKTLELFSLLFDRHVHKNGTEPAQVCAFLCYSSALLLSVYSPSCSPSLSYVPCTLIYMHNKAACIVNVCPKCICECCLWKMKSAGGPFSPPCKGVGCTPISC